MQIYLDVGVLLLRFKYTEHLPKLCFRAKYMYFHMEKSKVNNFIAVVKFPLYFWFLIFSLFQYLSCIFCYVKSFYYALGDSHLFSDYFLIIKENTLRITFESAVVQLQVPTITYNFKFQ